MPPRRAAGVLARLMSLSAPLLWTMSTGVSAGQMNLTYHSGQAVIPVYEGWEPNPDGSFTMYFGYFNRNWDQAPDIPIGPDNAVQPGAPDQGQPTHFLPRRNQFVYKIRLPKDWGTKEVVWTLTANGQTQKAYGALAPTWAIDNNIIAVNNYGLGGAVDPVLALKNRPPTVAIDSNYTRTLKIGESVVLAAVVADDGVPARRATVTSRPPGRNASLGVRVAWFLYRGPGEVHFDPPQFKVNQDPRGNSPWTSAWEPPPIPSDGKMAVKAIFNEPGSYVVRVLAHDGWLGAYEDFKVTVTR